MRPRARRARTHTTAQAFPRDSTFTKPDTLVTEVASAMAEHKYGAVTVVQNTKVVGVFTTVDACRVLAELFDTRLR